MYHRVWYHIHGNQNLCKIHTTFNGLGDDVHNFNQNSIVWNGKEFADIPISRFTAQNINNRVIGTLSQIFRLKRPLWLVVIGDALKL